MRITGAEQRSGAGGGRGRFPHLVAPQPLEGQAHLQQDGDDPREVNVANDLKEDRRGLVRLVERERD